MKLFFSPCYRARRLVSSVTGFFILLLSNKSYSQRAEPFIYDCVIAGQDMRIDAVIKSAGASTYYRWQYKINGDWTCFKEGINIINNVPFSVTGTFKAGGADDAPLLTIINAGTALEDVLVRVIMANATDPCITGTSIWGGDDLGMNDTKYLRLHVTGNAAQCPPNAFSCTDNMLANGSSYFGGFEDISYNPATETYSRANIDITSASTDLSFGNNSGQYQDINNPYMMSTAFARNIAPHSGNYQFVIKGNTDINTRLWYKKGITVLPGHQYRFALWAVRIDNTDPSVTMKITAGQATTILMTYDLGNEPVGQWKLIQGTYSTPPGVNSIDISITDSKSGGLNNFSIDDLCFRSCLGCATLPLHHLDLRATLQGNNVNLKWIAENEMNTSNFIIERSVDGINFSPIGSSLPIGPLNTPTNYLFVDNVQPLSQQTVVYYRIKAMDNDSRFAYSNIATVRLGKSTAAQVWPNPFDGFINISYTATAATTIHVAVVDNTGKTIRQGNYAITRGMNQFSITDLGSLSDGIYFIRITDKNTDQQFIQKISRLSP